MGKDDSHSGDRDGIFWEGCEECENLTSILPMTLIPPILPESAEVLGNIRALL